MNTMNMKLILIEYQMIDNLGDKAKNVLEQLSSDYNRFR